MRQRRKHIRSARHRKSLRKKKPRSTASALLATLAEQDGLENFQKTVTYHENQASQSNSPLNLISAIVRRSSTITEVKTFDFGKPIGVVPTNARIALVSWPFDYKREFEDPPEVVEVASQEVKLLKIREGSYEKFKQQLLRLLRAAVEQGADIICLSELAYPYLAHLDQDLEKNIRETIDGRSHVVCGSFHSPKYYMNVTKVFSRSPLSGLANPMPHAKKTSATQIGEQVLVPFNREIRVYKTELGNIAVLICLDIYNPALILPLVRWNAEDGQVHFVFVPSYYFQNAKMDKVTDCVRELSILLGCAVFISHSNESAIHRLGYLCGEPIQERKTADPYLSVFDYSPVTLDGLLKQRLPAWKETLQNVVGLRPPGPSTIL